PRVARSGETDCGICWLGFVAADRTALLAERVFARARTGRSRDPLRLDLRGTNFQIKVWEALLKIPFARLATYQDVAAAIGDPRAARAVGGAVDANPISLVIPCHREPRLVKTLWAGGPDRFTRRRGVTSAERLCP